MVCDDIFVTSSGEMKLQKPVRTIRKSGRRDFLLLYVCEGTCVLSSDGGSLTAEKGSVVFYRPSEPQDYYFPAEPVNRQKHGQRQQACCVVAVFIQSNR